MKKGLPLKLRAAVALLAFMLFEALVGVWCINAIKEQNNKYYFQLVKEEARKFDERFQVIKAYWTISPKTSELTEFAALKDKAPKAIKQKALNHLKSMVKLTNAQFAFLMDLKGNCILSTLPILLGHNYGFRPYFKDALAKGSGFYMAYGVTSHTLGFYFSALVTRNDRPVGVAVIKIADKEMWPELFGNHKPSLDVLNGPFSGLITELGAIAVPGGKFYVLDEISPALRAYLATTRQFPINRIESLKFPPGTWNALKTERTLKVENPKTNQKYYLYSIPLKAPGLLLFYSIPEKVMATIFKGVIQPIYLVLLVLFLSFMTMTALFLLKEEREKRLEEEHKRYVELSSRYKRIIDTAQEGFWVVHPKKRTIVEVNNAICKILGYSSEELIGKRPFDLVDEENLKILKEQASLPDNQCCNFQVEMLRKDGTKRLLHVSSAFVPGDKPEDSFRFAFLTDITEKREWEEAVARKDAILEAVSRVSSLIVEREISEESTREFMSLLGEAASLNTISVNKIGVKGEEILFTTIASWNAKGSFSIERIAATCPNTPEMEACLERLRSGEPVHETTYLCKEVRKLLFEEESPKFRSMLPIILEKGELWGALVLESQEEREWLDIEVEAFKVAANLISATIKRDRIQREKQREELKYTTLVENAKSIILRISPEGNIIFINKFGLDFFGYESHEIVGKHVVGTIVPPVDSKGRNMEILIQNILNEPEKFSKGENENICSNGKRVWISWTNTPLRNENGELLEILSVGHDITKRKQIEERLKEASEAKSVFLANMSHEIRTPLTAIIGMSQLLEETSLNEEQQRFVNSIQNAGKALLSIINDVLDLAKIEAGKMEYKQASFNLMEVMEEAIGLFFHHALEKGVELHCHIAPSVPLLLVGDAPKLGQIFRNLLGNSVKFTQKGSIVLSASMVSLTGDEAEILFKVIDTGEGIPREKLESVFEPFQQADSSVTRKVGGTGLGLTITREFILGMGGKVWIESEEQKGTVVSFQLPFKLDKESSLPPECQDILDSIKEIAQHWKAVVADEDYWTRLVVSDILRRFKMPLREVSNGQELLQSTEELEESWNTLFIVDEEMVSPKVLQQLDTKKSACVLLSKAGTHQSSHNQRLQRVERPILPIPLLKAIIHQCKRPHQDPLPSREPKRTSLSEEKNARILLVEDAELNQVLMRTILEKEGYQVVVASNGLEALRKLSDEEFDLVLMDIQMPVMDGLTATRIIRAAEQGAPQNIPQDTEISAGLIERLIKRLKNKRLAIVAITAHAFEEELEKTRKAGMDLHLTKPIKLNEFRTVIKTLI